MKILAEFRTSSWMKVVMVLLALIAVALGAMQMKVAKEDEAKQPFLTLSKIVKSELQRETYILRENGRGATLVTGEEMKKWLQGGESTWTKKQAPSTINRAPNYTLYLDLTQGYELRLYKGSPNLAAVFYGGRYQYYEVPGEAYEKLAFLHAVKNYAVPEEVVKAILDGKMTERQSVNETPTNMRYKVLKIGNEAYYLYKDSGKYYCESPYQSIREISEDVYKEALLFAEEPTPIANEKFSKATVNLVEEGLKEIMSSPQTSSNPEDYIKAHQERFNQILDQGGDEALAYMQAELDQGRAVGLRGEILKRLCLARLGSK